MTKAWMVAWREYFYNLRRPAFLFAAFGAPIISIVAMVLVVGLISSSAQDTGSIGQVGYVDESGVLDDAVDQPEIFTVYTHRDDASRDLETGVIGAYFVVQEDYLQSGDVEIFSTRSIPEAIRDELDAFLIANLSRNIADADLLARVQDPVEMTVQIRDSGRELTENSVLGLFMVPTIFAVVFFIAMQTTSTYLMASVAEEKTNRIMEILVTSVTPLQLLLGKIVGLGTLGLTQLTFWLISGVVLLSIGQQSPFLAGVTLPPDLIVLALVYFVLSYFLYAGIMAGIGASSSSEQESRQVAGLVTFIGVIPFFFFVLFLSDPDSPIVTILTLVPFTAPLTVLLRSSLGTVPTVELIASLLILLASAVFAVWAAARVFRWSSLLYGQRVTPRQLWRVIRGQAESRIGTVVAQHEE